MGVGRTLIILGAVPLIAGAAILLFGRLGLPLGRLPGDIAYRGRSFSFYFPLGACLLLSVLLSLIFYFLSRFRR